MRGRSLTAVTAGWMLLAALPTVPMRAQLVDDARIGATMRVTMLTTSGMRGILVGQDSTSLVFRPSGNDTARRVRVLAVDIQRLDLLTGRRTVGSSVGRGALWGAIGGLVTSAAFFTAAAISDARRPCSDCVSTTLVAAVLAVPFTLGTTIIGAGIGAVKRDTWEEVHPRR